MLGVDIVIDNLMLVGGQSNNEFLADVHLFLGYMYYIGEGATKNYQKAYTHFLISISPWTINDYSKFEQYTVKKVINKLEKDLSPQAIEKAQNEAEKMIQNFKRTYGDK